MALPIIKHLKEAGKTLPVEDKVPYFPSTIEGNYGFFLRFFFKRIFSRVEIGTSEAATIKELQKRGLVIYALKSRSDLESVLYHFQYSHNGLPSPAFACDSNMVIFQTPGFVYKTFKRKFLYLFKYGFWLDPYNSGYIRGLVTEGRSMLVYLRDFDALMERFTSHGKDPVLEIIKAQRTIERPVFFVPQSVVWKKEPEKSKKRLDEILFGQRANPNGLRVLFNFLRFYRRSFIMQAEPLNLQDFLRKHPEISDSEACLKVREILINRISAEKRLITGPIAKSRHEVMEKVLYHPRVDKAIERRVKKTGRSQKAIRKEAYRILEEIAADYSIWMVRLWERLLTWAFNNIYDGVEINGKGLERVREAARSSTMVFVPCHRSHMDYLLVSYILYRNNLFPPFIAAGLNLAFWPVGTLFRKSGAFFIRRSFKGSVLYPVLVQQYVHTILEEGYPIEFFIEGGRSRSGKIALPKLGFLSILVEALYAGRCKELCFVPIAINYDRVMEEKLYQIEIRGDEKPKENLISLVKSYRLIRKRYGKIYVNFHEPIPLSSYIENTSSSRRKQIPHMLGFTLARSIQEAMIVLPSNLTAAVMLATARRGFSLQQLKKTAAMFYEFLKEQDVRMAPSLENPEQMESLLLETLESFVKEKIIARLRLDKEEKKEGEEDIVYELRDKDRLSLEYYKNTIVHFFIPISFVACSVASAGEERASLVKILDDALFMRELFSNDMVMPSDAEMKERILSALGFLERTRVIYRREDGYGLLPAHRGELLCFARLIQSTFEAYYVVAKSLRFLYRRRLSEKRFMRKVHARGQKLFQTGRVIMPESLSRISYQNALQFFVDQKILQRQIDKTLREGTYITLTGRRRKNLWKRAKSLLSIYQA